MTRRTGILIALLLLAAPLIVAVGSMLAGRYYYETLTQTPSPSSEAENTVLGVPAQLRSHPIPAGASKDVTVTEQTTAYGEETTASPEETTASLGPPDTTLSYGGREVRTSPSPSYCWSTSNGGMCADGLPSAPGRKKTLTVPSGAEMVFHYESQSPPNKVTASAARPYVGTSPYKLTRDPSSSLEVHGSGVERAITAELPPGEYLVFVGTTAPQGELSYIFRVMVQ